MLHRVQLQVYYLLQIILKTKYATKGYSQQGQRVQHYHQHHEHQRGQQGQHDLSHQANHEVPERDDIHHDKAEAECVEGQRRAGAKTHSQSRTSRSSSCTVFTLKDTDQVSTRRA